MSGAVEEEHTGGQPQRSPAEVLHDRFQEQLRVTREQLDAANETIKKRTGRDLVMAILIGLGLGAVIVASLIFFKIIFVLVLSIAVALGAVELSGALRINGSRVPRIPVGLAAFSLPLGAYLLGAEAQWLLLVLGVGLVALWRGAEQLVPGIRTSAGTLLRDWAASAFVLAYVPFLASFAALLVAEEGGQWWVLAFVAIVVAIDTGAYASGLSFGRHPMAPRISPKKTWEGFAGAVVSAFVAGLLLAWLMLDQPLWVGALLAAVLLLVATAGDLAESVIKRDIGVKDMSSWLPGHGGMLDRLDSMLPSCAAAYFVFQLVSTVG